MGEPLAVNGDSGWTDERCREFIQEFEARRRQHVGSHDYGRFMEEHAGTFPKAVVEYIWREGRGDFQQAVEEGRATHLPAGELARALNRKILLGVEVVSTDSQNGQAGS